MRLLIAILTLAVGVTGLGSASQQPGAANADALTYWCPMHRDVRGAAGEKCPLCGMALVRVVAADYRPYALDVEVVPNALPAGQRGRVRFVVRERE